MGAIVVTAHSVAAWVEHNQSEKRKSLASMANVIMRRAKPTAAVAAALLAMKAKNRPNSFSADDCDDDGGGNDSNE